MVTNSMYYPSKTKATTNFLRINVTCTNCKNHGTNCKYTIVIEKSPFDEKLKDKENALVQVTHEKHNHTGSRSRSNSRSHLRSSSSSSSIISSKSSSLKSLKSSSSLKIKQLNQITVSERTQISLYMQGYHGSAALYRDGLISKGETNVVSEEVYRKIIFEFNNKNSVGHDWYKNLKASSATFLPTITSSKTIGLSGYVQFCTDFPKLEIILFMEKQLPCLFKWISS